MSEPPILDPKEVERKLQAWFELCQFAKELSLAGLKHENPAASRAELVELLRKRLPSSPSKNAPLKNAAGRRRAKLSRSLMIAPASRLRRYVAALSTCPANDSP